MAVPTTRDAKKLPCYLKMSVASLHINSSTIFDSALHTYRAFLACQSRHFTWSARITPCISYSLGRLISKGYPLACEVMGQNNAKPDFSLYKSGDTAIAGLRPACSCPIWTRSCPSWGLKSSHTISPRPGTPRSGGDPSGRCRSQRRTAAEVAVGRSRTPPPRSGVWITGITRFPCLWVRRCRLRDVDWHR